MGKSEVRMTTEQGIECPSCQGKGLTKFGKTVAGRQKYRCVACGRQFVAGSVHLLTPETKEIVMGLLSSGVSPVHIKAAIPSVSLRWIYELRRRARHDRQD